MAEESALDSNIGGSVQVRMESMPGAIREGDAYLLVETPEAKFTDEQLADLTAMKIVLQDIQNAEGFLNSKLYIQQWNLAEVLLFAYVKPEKWKGTDQDRSHLGIPLLAEQLHSMLSGLQQALFSGVRPYQVDPSSGTQLDTALAEEALLGWGLKTCGTKGGSYKQEMRWCIYDGLMYGTGVGFLGWKTQIKTRKRWKKKNPDISPTGMDGKTIPGGDPDEVESYDDEFEVNRPVFEYVNIRRLRVDPGCRRSDIRTAQWVARLIYLSSDELDSLRDVVGYTNIPSRENFRKLTAPTKEATSQNQLEVQGIDWGLNRSQKALPENRETTNDPLAKKWEIIEYWTDARVIRVLERKIPISNTNHDLGRIPFVSFNLHEAPDSFYGLGLAHLVGDFQRICQGVINAYLDDLALNLMGVYTSPRGLNQSAQAEWIYPGKIFKSDSEQPFKALERNASRAEDALGMVAQAKQWASAITGAGVGIQGSNPGQVGNLRTTAGANLLSQGEETRMQDLADQIADLMMIPTLEFFIDMFSAKLKPSQVKQILSDELKQQFTADPLDLLNGQYRVTVSAGARLAARRALGSSLGFIVQMLQSPGLTDQLATQAKKINYDQMLKVIFETTGYPYYESIVQPMNDEDRQRLAAQSQAAQAQSKAALQSQATQGKISVNENQAENRALLKAQEIMFLSGDKQFSQEPQ